MQKIRLLVVGNIKESFFRDAINEYSKRLSRFCDLEIRELEEFNGGKNSSVEQIRRCESANILKNLDGFTVVLDSRGKLETSEGIAKIIEDASIKGDSRITFVIGGSHGLTEEVLNRANVVLSFGKITFPHQLMRVVLTEQIYRAFTILNNIKYHK